MFSFDTFSSAPISGELSEHQTILARLADLSSLMSTDRLAESVWGRVIDGGYTAEQILRVMAAALAGKASGAGTGTVTFKSIDGIKDRVIADVDGTGNRTAVVLDGE